MSASSRLLALMLPVASISGLVGCPTSEPPPPAPPSVPDPITSVDGLTGGTITGSLTIVDGQVSAPGLVVTDIVVAPEVQTNQLFAINADVDNLSVLQTMDVASPPTVAGGNTITPTFVGSAQRPVSPSGQATRAVAQGACAAAFEGSHICHEDELRLAIRTSTVEPDEIDGLTVESAPRVIGVAQIGQPAELAQVVNDNCGDWTISPDAAGDFVSTPAEPIADGVTGLVKLHGRSEVSMTDGFAIKNVGSCLPADVVFACCR
jgi:hypothetical protein